MYFHDIQIRVRYAETDQMGYVYYGNYATYFEVGRVECLRNLGISYKELEEQGVMLPVRENKSTYLAPAKYDDLLIIRTIIKDLPSAKITFNHEIYNKCNANEQLIHTGETLLVFVNKENGRPCKPPENLINVLTPFFSKDKN